MSGVIQGGWDYVIAAYAVTGVVFVAYGISVYARLRAATRRSS